MIEVGYGGSIIITSSIAGVAGSRNISHYAASKHGLVGLMRSLANELAPHGIRVNSVHPTTVERAFIVSLPSAACDRGWPGAHARRRCPGSHAAACTASPACQVRSR